MQVGLLGFQFVGSVREQEGRVGAGVTDERGEVLSRANLDVSCSVLGSGRSESGAEQGEENEGRG